MTIAKVIRLLRRWCKIVANVPTRTTFIYSQRVLTPDEEQKVDAIFKRADNIFDEMDELFKEMK